MLFSLFGKTIITLKSFFVNKTVDFCCFLLYNSRVILKRWREQVATDNGKQKVTGWWEAREFPLANTSLSACWSFFFEVCRSRRFTPVIAFWGNFAFCTLPSLLGKGDRLRSKWWMRCILHSCKSRWYHVIDVLGVYFTPRTFLFVFKKNIEVKKNENLWGTGCQRLDRSGN